MMLLARTGSRNFQMLVESIQAYVIYRYNFQLSYQKGNVAKHFDDIRLGNFMNIIILYY